RRDPHDQDHRQGQQKGREVRLGKVDYGGVEFFKKVRVSRRNLQANGIVELARENDDRDPGGKAGDKGVRDIEDKASHPREAEGDLENAGQDGGDPELLDPILRDDPGEDDRHGAGGTGDLDFGAAEEGGDDGGDDGGIEPVLGVHPGGERESEGQGEGDDGGGDSAPEVARDVDKVIPFQKG